MKVLSKLFAGFLNADPEPKLLDHVPIGTPAMSDAHRRKLLDAAARYRKPFKCAAADQDREVYVVPGEIRVARACGVAIAKVEVPDGDREYASWGVREGRRDRALKVAGSRS